MEEVTEKDLEKAAEWEDKLAKLIVKFADKEGIHPILLPGILDSIRIKMIIELVKFLSEKQEKTADDILKEIPKI